MMKLLSWNVNGLRACINKGFLDVLKWQDPDIISLQEIKMQKEQLEGDFEGYFSYFHSAEKKGYSGTAILTKKEPLSVSYDIGNLEFTGEGRSITLEFEDFYLVNVYTPNSQQELVRLPYRMKWDDAFREYVCSLDKIKPVLICGDMNVAHREIDIKNPKTNHFSAGFSDEERGKFSELLAYGFVDSFRLLYPNREDAYSWWSYRQNARERNVGWRIDYFLVSERAQEKIKEAMILSEIEGSDHCPVGIIFE